MPPPGSPIRLITLLDPPPGPASPGAYDFARDAWFEGIGGVGLALALARSKRTCPRHLGAFGSRDGRQQRCDGRPRARLGGEHQVHDGRRTTAGAAGLAVAVTTSHQDWLTPRRIGTTCAPRGSRTCSPSPACTPPPSVASPSSPFGWPSRRGPGSRCACLAKRSRRRCGADRGGGLSPCCPAPILPRDARRSRPAWPSSRYWSIGGRSASIRLADCRLDHPGDRARRRRLPGVRDVVLRHRFAHRSCRDMAPTHGAHRPVMAARVGCKNQGIGWSPCQPSALSPVMATGPFAIQHFNRVANYGVFANLSADFLASVVLMPALGVSLTLPGARRGSCRRRAGRLLAGGLVRPTVSSPWDIGSPRRHGPF